LSYHDSNGEPYPDGPQPVLYAVELVGECGGRLVRTAVEDASGWATAPPGLRFVDTYPYQEGDPLWESHWDVLYDYFMHPLGKAP
jgi:hypothetical protein